MRRSTKDEEDLIKQIESDPELDKKWSAPIKGRVVEIRYLDHSTTELILFLQKGPKTGVEILARIPGFGVDTLGKVRTLELIEHHNNTVWLTGAGVRLAKSLSRLEKSL